MLFYYQGGTISGTQIVLWWRCKINIRKISSMQYKNNVKFIVANIFETREAQQNMELCDEILFGKFKIYPVVACCRTRNKTQIILGNKQLGIVDLTSYKSSQDARMYSGRAVIKSHITHVVAHKQHKYTSYCIFIFIFYICMASHLEIYYALCSRVRDRILTREYHGNTWTLGLSYSARRHSELVPSTDISF